jgi:hypothetical protein
VEELDSDDTDTGVGNLTGKRYASDSLRFTGGDLAPQGRARKTYEYSESDSNSEEDTSEDEGNESTAQVALRDKEEALVQSAMARIRRAQEKGKLDVKLQEDEWAALERRRQRLQAEKKRKDSDRSSGSERRRKNERPMVTVPITQVVSDTSRRRQSLRNMDDSPPLPPSGPPGMRMEGPDGEMMYAPMGYYPPSSTNSPSRARSSSSLTGSHRGIPAQLMAGGYPYATGRHLSEGSRPVSSAGARPPLPHEEAWRPDSRGSREEYSGRAIDPFEFQTSDGEYGGGGRRYVSGPAEIMYSSLKRSPPMQAARPYPEREREPRRREETSESEEESEDGGSGVRVVPEREREKIVVVEEKKPKKSSGGRKKGRR